MQKIRIFEAFAGYGSQLMALKRLQAAFPNEIEIEPIGISEIDPHAIKAYQAVHGDVTNYGDISKTQQARMAGNSIVCACMYHIFRKLFIDTNEENEQLSLF